MTIQTLQEIKLKKGETTTLHFKGLGTSGYQWNYTINGNTSLVDVSKDMILPGQVKDMAMGANADEVFTIKALNIGVVNIHFVQARSWEKNVDPANEKMVKITIG